MKWQKRNMIWPPSAFLPRLQHQRPQRVFATGNPGISAKTAPRLHSEPRHSVVASKVVTARLRYSQNDQSQRMLNAIEPGTVMLIYRHHVSSETVICIRGHFEEYLFDEKGVLIETIDMRPCGAGAIQAANGKR